MKKKIVDKKRFISGIIKISLGVIMLVAFIILGKNGLTNNKPVEKTDAEKFASEYTTVTKENVFAYKSANEIIDILSSGTGVVYLGFPECKWCQSYVIYLNEVAKEVGIDKIYYYNIKDDRANNTKNYQTIIGLIGDSLQKDEEGNPRIYVPDVTFVKEGKIIGHDYETSLDTLGFSEPVDYWTEERATLLKTKLNNLMQQVKIMACETCN